MATSFVLGVIDRGLEDDNIVDERLGCFAGYSRHGLLAWIEILGCRGHTFSILYGCHLWFGLFPHQGST